MGEQRRAPRKIPKIVYAITSAGTTSRLVIAAPYPHEQFVQILAPDVERVLGAGGRVGGSR